MNPSETAARVGHLHSHTLWQPAEPTRTGCSGPTPAWRTALVTSSVTRRRTSARTEAGSAPLLASTAHLAATPASGPPRTSKTKPSPEPVPLTAEAGLRGRAGEPSARAARCTRATGRRPALLPSRAIRARARSPPAARTCPPDRRPPRCAPGVQPHARRARPTPDPPTHGRPRRGRVAARGARSSGAPTAEPRGRFADGRPSD